MSHVAMNARDLWMSIPAAGRSFSEKVEPEVAKITQATLVESRGKAPAEYEFGDEW